MSEDPENYLGDMHDPAFLARADAMRLLSPDRMPNIAANLLVRGFDTPALREVAGMAATANAFDLEDNFSRALRELGYRSDDTAALRWAQARAWAKDMVERRLSLARGARLIWWEVANHVEGSPAWVYLARFIGLADEWNSYPASRARVEAAIHACALALLRDAPTEFPG